MRKERKINYLNPDTYQYTSNDTLIYENNYDNCSKKGNTQINLVSDIELTAINTDPKLVNPWGIINYDNSLWVAVSGSSLIQRYSRNGVLLKSITTTGTPTGIVVNCNNFFQITHNAITLPAEFLICTDSGTIEGYNRNLDPTQTIVLVPANANNIYKGIAIHKGYIYVTNVKTGYIDKYDSGYNLVNSFTDIYLWNIKYHPFNVYSDCKNLYVSFAKINTNTDVEIPGIGNGYVDVFMADASFKRLIDRSPLNAPWGMCIKGDILYVGNFGDGRINTFSSANGEFYGPLLDSNSNPIVIDGLQGIICNVCFYHDELDDCCQKKKSTSCDAKKKKYVYDFAFAAAIDSRQHGLVGYLK